MDPGPHALSSWWGFEMTFGDPPFVAGQPLDCGLWLVRKIDPHTLTAEDKKRGGWFDFPIDVKIILVGPDGVIPEGYHDRCHFWL